MVKKKFKLKKYSKNNDEALLKQEISNWIDLQLGNKYFSEEKNCYVNEIQKGFEIEVIIKEVK